MFSALRFSVVILCVLLGVMLPSRLALCDVVPNLITSENDSQDAVSDFGSVPALTDAQESYRMGDFEASLVRVQSVLVHWDSLDDEGKQQACLLRVRLAFAFEDVDQAKLWLRKIYEIQPEFELDSLIDPPEAHQLWAQVRFDAASSQEMHSDSFLPRPDLKPILALMPFGVGQAQNGQWLKGGVIALIESIAFLRGAYSRDVPIRSKALTVGILTMLYGGYDGWIHLHDGPARYVGDLHLGVRSVRPFWTLRSPHQEYAFGIAIRQPL